MGQQRELNSPTSVSPPINLVKNTILPSPSSDNFEIPKSNVILQPPVHIDNATVSLFINTFKFETNHFFLHFTEQSSSNTNLSTTQFK